MQIGTSEGRARAEQTQFFGNAPFRRLKPELQCPDLVATWSDEEVARRWLNIFPQRKTKTKEGAPAEPRETDLLMITGNPERLAEIRRRLSSIPWFMQCLVEPIARKANREDKCSGRF